MTRHSPLLESQADMFLSDFHGLWSILPDRLSLATPFSLEKPKSDIPTTQVAEYTFALLDIAGPLSRIGYWGTSTAKLVAQLKEVSSRPDIDAAVLLVDSPGGSVAGQATLVEALQNFRSDHYLFSYSAELAASAAYGILSQADLVYAGKGALIGGIGVYAVLVDSSKFYEDFGFRVIVSRAGKFKGIGVAGTKITEEQEEEVERLVSDFNDQFVEAVAVGRGLEERFVRNKLNDGRVHIAKDARALQLVDGIATLDAAMVLFADHIRGSVMARSKTDPDPAQSSGLETQPTSAASVPTPIVASTPSPAAPTSAVEDSPVPIAELRTRFAAAGADFILQQVEANATLLQASLAFGELMQKRAEQAQQQAQQQAPAATMPAPPVAAVGNDPVVPAAPDTSKATLEDWRDLVAKEIASGRDRADAVLQVEKTHPGLRVAALNNVDGGRVPAVPVNYGYRT